MAVQRAVIAHIRQTTVLAIIVKKDMLIKPTKVKY